MNGIKLENCKNESICLICIEVKTNGNQYPKSAEYRAKRRLEIIHSDLCGPIQIPTIGEKSYFITFIDDYSRYCIIYLTFKKSEDFEKLKDYVATKQKNSE